MPLDYLKTDNIAIARLKAAHDSGVSKIRTAFFAAEYAFFKQHIRDSRVLVAGSGLGHDTFELAQYNASITGVELHPELVQEAMRLNQFHRLYHVAFVQGDFFKLNYPDVSFDAAVLNMGTIGTLDGPEKALKELLRVARVVCADFYPATPEAIAKRIKMYTEEGWKNVRFDEAKSEIVSDDGMSSKSVSIADVRGWAKHCGAKVELYEFCDFAIMAELRR